MALIRRLELDHLSLALLVTAKFKMLAALQWGLLAVFAVGTLHSQHDFLRSFGLLSEDRLSLTTKTLLLTVVTTTTLRRMTFLGFLVLGHLVHAVSLALFAESAPGFWYIHHFHTPTSPSRISFTD